MEAKKTTSTVERRKLIMEKLDAEGRLDVTSLSKELGVSEVTIRNDLNWLEKKKYAPSRPWGSYEGRTRRS
jgi:DeoR family transcriptional regulator of aga operon